MDVVYFETNHHFDTHTHTHGEKRFAMNANPTPYRKLFAANFV